MSNRFAIKNGLLQSDIDFAGFKRLNDATPGGGGGGGGAIPGVFKNVMDAPYNAKGDDTTDDTASIQGAINDVFNLGGGTVFFPRPSAKYLCNGAFDSITNSILKIPLVAATTGKPRVIRLVGEAAPMWLTYGPPAYAVTIRTSSNGSGTAPALLAGNNASYYGSTMDPHNMSQVKVEVKNLSFELPANTATWGIRFDSVGMAIIEDVNILAGSGVGNTHGAIGLVMPVFINMSQSQVNRVLSIGFDTGMLVGELLVMQWSYLSQCNVGILLTGGNGPAFRAHVLCDTCTVGARFANAPSLYASNTAVDMIYFHEHNPSNPTTYDIDDSTNAGGGIIRYTIANASVVGINTSPILVNGGANLRLIPMNKDNSVVKQPSYATPTTINQIVACLQAAGLCA